MSALLMALLLVGRTLFADGAWATFDRGANCAAVSRSERIASDPASQAQASFSFDRSGGRVGQLALGLSRVTRAGSGALLTIGERPFLLVAGGRFAWSRGPAQEAAIIAAMRTATTMRVEARSTAGGRFVDLYRLDGAPGAIDAAAACAARR